MIVNLPISTRRLILRAFTADDAEAFHGWRNEADVARYTLWAYPYPMKEAVAFCREQAAMTPFEQGEWYQLFIEDRTTGEGIGDIGVGNGATLMGQGVVSIGYSLAGRAQGSGRMTEALKALLPALVEPLGVTKFVAEIDARNLASGRVLEKLGFRAGPVQRGRSFVKGEWCDEIDYTLDVDEAAVKPKE